MNTGPGACPPALTREPARATGENSAENPRRGHTPAEADLQSEKQLDEYAALLGLRYDARLKRFSVK